MKKIINIFVAVLSVFMLSGCVSKMVGGAVSIATLGLVEDDTIKKNDVKMEKYKSEKNRLTESS